LTPMVALSMASTNWCLASGLPPWFTLLSIFLHDHLSKISVLLCQNVEVLCYVAATFDFMLQEAYSLNAAIIKLSENSSNSELLNISRQHMFQSGYYLILHTTH
jgi:hypothetical protein